MDRLLLNALACKNEKRPPVWLMRQAGRYLPEYRAIRARHSFLEMCHHPELIAEITLQPIKRFGFDAAILFSDILMIPEVLKMGLRFEEGIGPIIDHPVRDYEGVKKLSHPDLSQELSFMSEGIKILKKELNVPLLGFCGAPFTVASYMIEGGASKDLRKTKTWMVREPEGFHLLLNKIADLTVDYLNMQILAGVDAVQIFDSWAFVLAHHQFREFSHSYIQKIKQGLIKDIPFIIFCKGSSVFAPEFVEMSPQAISIDWNADLSKLRQKIPSTIALQGNLDPDILYGSKAFVRQEVLRILKGMEGDQGFIFNLGHGIHPDIPLESVYTLVETVKTFQPLYAEF